MRTLPTRSTRALVYAGDRCIFKLILWTGRRRAPEASGHSTAAEGKSYTAVQPSNLPEAEEDVAVTDPLLLPRSYFMSIVEGHNGRLSVCLSVIFHNSRSAALSLQYVNNANGCRPNGVGRAKRAERGAPHCEDVRVCVGGRGRGWEHLARLSEPFIVSADGAPLSPRAPPAIWCDRWGKRAHSTYAPMCSMCCIDMIINLFGCQYHTVFVKIQLHILLYLNVK